MRKKKIDLNVDSIGNQKEKLTKEEERMISDFISSHKKSKRQKYKKNKISA